MAFKQQIIYLLPRPAVPGADSGSVMLWGGFFGISHSGISHSGISHSGISHSGFSHFARSRLGLSIQGRESHTPVVGGLCGVGVANSGATRPNIRRSLKRTTRTTRPKTRTTKRIELGTVARIGRHTDKKNLSSRGTFKICLELLRLRWADRECCKL